MRGSSGQPSEGHHLGLPLHALAAAIALFAFFAFSSSAMASSSPVIESETVSGLTEHNATLEAQINTGGAATRYRFHLEYGCDISGNEACPQFCIVPGPCPGPVNGPVSIPLPSGVLPGSSQVEHVSLDLHEIGVTLEPDTKYRYSIEATNTEGTAEGSPQFFTTLSAGSSAGTAPPGEVQTGPAEQTSDGYKLEGKLNPENSPTSYYFIYKKAGEVECEDLEGCGPSTPQGGPLTGGTQQEASPTEVTGLEPNTTYIYWLIARNAHGTAVGRQLTFTTGGPEEAPSEVVTEPAESGSNGFRLTGKLNPGGLPTTYYFEYIGDNAYECLAGENCWPETAHEGPITGDSQQGVGSIEVTGLRLGETYRYRLVAENAKGTVRGNVVPFTVTQTFPASVGSESASNITENAATLEAQVNPHGEQTYLTTWVFEYGTSTSYGQSVPFPPGVFNSEQCKYDEDIPCTPFTTPQPVSENLTGLEPGTTYHYRIAATNSWGTSYGEDATFTTQSLRAHPLSSEKTPPSTGGNGQSGTSGTSAGFGESPPADVTFLSSALGSKAIELKPLTRAEKLTKALKICEKKPKKQRADCEKQVKKKYATVAKKSKST